MSSAGKLGYYETEVGWIPTDWTVSTLGAIGRCIRGVSYKPDHLQAENSESTVTLLRSNNIRDNRINLDEIQFVAGCRISDDQYAKPNDVAICMSNGSKALVGKSGVITSGQLKEHPKLTVGAFCSIYRSDFRYAAHIFNSDYYHAVVDLQLAGSAINNLKGKDIEGVRFPLPPVSEQEKIGDILTAVNNKLNVIARQIEATQTLKRGLTQILFHQGVGTQNADGRWVPHNDFKKVGSRTYPSSWQWVRMGSIAPIVRREVEVQPDSSYPELGLRSFGKGTFHKAALSGIEVGNKRLFIIKSGDLLLSNVFAWEGAIAVAKPADDSRYGSHRYITCVVDGARANADFIARYLVTPPGLTSIGLASPGGAGRNKTLGLSALADIEVPIPPLPEQLVINETLDVVQKKIFLLEIKRERLRALKRGLTQKLLTGEWRVGLEQMTAMAA
jgi:type I restriction enzyme, S subunit